MRRTTDELRLQMPSFSAEDRMTMPIPTERLAYWFFRVNGFLMVENFVVHREEGGGQGTDADILAVRFLRWQELRLSGGRLMRDYPHFDAFYSERDRKPLMGLVEVKADECDLNGPWTRPRKGKMQRLLNSRVRNRELCHGYVFPAQKKLFQRAIKIVPADAGTRAMAKQQKRLEAVCSKPLYSTD